MLRVSNIKLPIEKRFNILPAVCQRLRISEEQILAFTIYRESFDARRREQKFVYTVDVEVADETHFLESKIAGVTQASINDYQLPLRHDKIAGIRPIVVGTGPCGLFAALLLAKAGYRPLVLERGVAVDQRTKDIEAFWQKGVLNKQSNMQFGEGGAGTFSDGKLTTNIKDPRCRFVLQQFVAYGAPAEILYSYRPHIGTDLLRGVVRNIRHAIIEHGGDVRFNAMVTDIKVLNDQVRAVIVNGVEEISADTVIVAIGHSARDTYRMLYDHQVEMEAKPFSIGLRIEHTQDGLNQAQFGSYAGHPNLEPADYRLKYHASNGRSAYSFCMCPGGFVVASSSAEQEVVTNGMSRHARDATNANSALLVGVNPADYFSDHPLAGIVFQQHWEQLAFQLGGNNYYAPAQLVGDFLKNRPSDAAKSIKPSYLPGVAYTNLAACLPEYVTETLREALLYWGNQIACFKDQDAVLTGVETRSSAPVRLVRGDNYQSNIRGIHPAGEGAGYAGGIISAAVDGLRVAEKIIDLKNS